MKKVCTTTLALLLTVPLFAPNPGEDIMTICAPTPIKYNMELENRKIRIFSAIWAVEHPKTKAQARAAFLKEGALGPFQIHKEFVNDVNDIVLKQKKYTHNDCLDSLKSIEIMTLYHGYYVPAFDTYKVAMTHNGGPTWYKATPKQAKKLQEYWYKVNKHLKKNGRS